MEGKTPGNITILLRLNVTGNGLFYKELRTFKNKKITDRIIKENDEQNPGQ
jgi:hypothetical protein